jgi:hypothetical protein
MWTARNFEVMPRIFTQTEVCTSVAAVGKMTVIEK